MVGRRPAAVVAVALAVGLAGCASTGIRRAALASEQYALTLEQAQGAIERLRDQGAISAGDALAWQRGFRRLAEVGLTVNGAIRAGDGAGVAAQLRGAVEVLDELERVDVARLPAAAQSSVRLALAAARGVLVTLSIVFEGG